MIIITGVSVAGIICQPDKSRYERTEQIVCKIDGPGKPDERSGPVIVKVADFRGESKQNYRFVDPKPESIEPKHGPKSGGTLLTIRGKYMNAGSVIRAFIDDLPCIIQS